MAYLILECLEKIFLNLHDDISIDNFYANTSTKDLYSCTLVSRHWCRVSTPLLYAYPFHHFRHLVYPTFYNYDLPSPYFKLIRTLLSCIPKSEIEQIISLDSSNEQILLSKLSGHPNKEFFSFNPMFNYITFIRGIIFDKLLFTYSDKKIQRWLSSYFISNNATKDQISKTSFPITNHLIKYLCTQCNGNLKKLEFPFISDDECLNKIIKRLTYNEQSRLDDLRELYYINYYNSSKVDLYFGFSNSVHNLNLLYNEGNDSDEKANSLSHFISLQKKLQHIILSENCLGFILDNYIGKYYNIVFESLSTQSENLRTLKLRNIPFNEINEKALKSLCLLKNISELELYYCIGINESLNIWAKNLTRLEVFELTTQNIRDVSEGFLIQLIQSSSSTLNKLIINNKRRYRRSFFQQIPLLLNSLIHLDITIIYLDELIIIFESCKQLVYLGIILSIDDELCGIELSNLGKLIPKNLQKIKFKKMDNLVFNSDQMKCFFEECVNNDSKLKYLEIIGKCEIDQEYFDVADEFGIQIINY
ncbi:hypothetical protein RclHR1_00030043 [Rhizophagus clarus]|uniref:Uncharacterized protein n=1 Tax=Rhizophagus clarus TaxID=94130 RepID=A0A2Z6RZD4_9GLOM|nr:hypothetical protein RclHR1_00030043 [Rhizophagus clarus]GES95550.1 hypothetical protein GLOIN_2v1769480 [Rhizophagus clarus]